MRMDELKRGLFGYKKDSVYHYILSVEEKASARVAEKEARLAELEAEMKRQIAGLEATVTALQKENAALQENQSMVLSTMMEAQRYADQLREDSASREQQAQDQLSAAIQQKNQQLDTYRDEIRQLRANIQRMLREFDDRLEDTEHALIRLRAQTPAPELNETPADLSGTAVPDAGGKGGVMVIPTVPRPDSFRPKDGRK